MSYAPLDDALMWLRRMGIDLKIPKFNILASFMTLSTSIVFILEFMHICYNYNSIEIIAGVCEIFLSVYLVVAKFHMMIIHRKALSKMIEKIYNFWPIDKFDKELHQDLVTKTKTIAFLLSFYRWFAVITTSMFIRFTNFWKSNKTRLPFVMYEPVDMHYSPVFEMMFVFQFFICFFTSFVNIAVDSLFASIVAAIIFQFRLLGAAYRNLKVGGNDDEEKENFEKMKTYIKYHDHLIRMVREVQETHGLLFLSMFVSSSVYVVIDLYLGANDRMFDDLRKLMTYICQGSFFVFLLFVYCFAGNQLTYECYIVGDQIYESDWWSNFSKRNRNGVLFVIERAQKLEKLTAGGLIQLDFVNFIRMLRLSFSFFTLLRKSRKKTI